MNRKTATLTPFPTERRHEPVTRERGIREYTEHCAAARRRIDEMEADGFDVMITGAFADGYIAMAEHLDTPDRDIRATGDLYVSAVANLYLRWQAQKDSATL